MRNYYNQEERWLEDKQGDTRIVLDDGSLWEISPHDRRKVQNWVRFSNMSVRIDEGKVTEYRFVLVNRSYDERASAKYLGMTADHQGGRRYIA